MLAPCQGTGTFSESGSPSFARRPVPSRWQRRSPLEKERVAEKGSAFRWGGGSHSVLWRPRRGGGAFCRGRKPTAHGRAGPRSNYSFCGALEGVRGPCTGRIPSKWVGHDQPGNKRDLRFQGFRDPSAASSGQDAWTSPARQTPFTPHSQRALPGSARNRTCQILRSGSHALARVPRSARDRATLAAGTSRVGGKREEGDGATLEDGGTALWISNALCFQNVSWNKG